MEQLIKIRETKTGKAVSARELYKFLKVSERFNNWIARQFQYGFEEGIDYLGCKEFNTLANQEVTDFILTIDTAKEISMLQRNPIGKKARQYFIECEKAATNPFLNISKAEALRIAAKAEEEKERLLEVNTIQEETIKIQAPKVNYFDNVLQSTSSYTTNQIAKEFGLSARSLNAKLQEIGVQYKQNGTWLLYAKHQNKGYTKTKTHTYVDALGNPGTQMQTVWTEKGRKFIHELMNEGKLELAS